MLTINYPRVQILQIITHSHTDFAFIRCSLYSESISWTFDSLIRMLERRKSQYKLTERRGAGAGVRRTPTRWSRVSPTSDEHNEPVYCAVGFSDGHRIQVCSWNKFQPVRCYKTSKSFESCSKLEILIDIQEFFDISKYRFMEIEILGRFSLKFVWTKNRFCLISFHEFSQQR